MKTREFFNTWVIPEPEYPIAKVIDKGEMQITVSKYPTDTYGRPVDSKGRPLH